MEQVKQVLDASKVVIPDDPTDEQIRDLVVVMAVLVRNKNPETIDLTMKMFGDLFKALEAKGLSNRITKLIINHGVKEKN